MKKKYTDEERKEIKRQRARVKYHRVKNTEQYKETKKRYRDTHKEEIKELRVEYYIKNKEKLNDYTKTYSKSLNGRYSQYKSSAKSRNLVFDLTFEEFSSFWQQRCVYCNTQIESIGIDRIDSNKGYEKDNIVSCCEICNKIKLQFSTDFFLAHIEKILTFTKTPIEKFDCIVPYKKGVPSKYTKAKSVSKTINREFTISKKEFMELQKRNCSYCGCEENIGVDRINSSKGYILNNCISCCPICNRMKNQHSLSNFYLHLIKISEHQIKLKGNNK